MTPTAIAAPHTDQTDQTEQPDQTEQLVLLTEEAMLPAQFRLDQRTRERGLAHVAALRAQIAARAAARHDGGLATAA